MNLPYKPKLCAINMTKDQENMDYTIDSMDISSMEQDLNQNNERVNNPSLEMRYDNQLIRIDLIKVGRDSYCPKEYKDIHQIIRYGYKMLNYYNKVIMSWTYKKLNKKDRDEGIKKLNCLLEKWKSFSHDKDDLNKFSWKNEDHKLMSEFEHVYELHVKKIVKRKEDMNPKKSIRIFYYNIMEEYRNLELSKEKEEEYQKKKTQMKKNKNLTERFDLDY